MFEFIAIGAMIIIISFSQSYPEDIFLSLLMLVPILLIKAFYLRNIYKKMGMQLIQLKKTYSEEHSLRSTLVIMILAIIFIVALSYFSSDSKRIGLPLIIFIGLEFLYERYMGRFLQKSLMTNGICTGSRIIEWGRIQSFKWVTPRKKTEFNSLKITYSSFYSTNITYLGVLHTQKDEVDKLLKETVGTK